jgi:transcriptional regulator GlxA family with amidase domain
VTLVAMPNVIGSILYGFNDLLNSIGLLAGGSGARPGEASFVTEIVGLQPGETQAAFALPVVAARGLSEVESSDVVILPAVLLPGGEWQCGQYPAFTGWLHAMHRRGAVLASACSGAFFLAETGLLDGNEATLQSLYGPVFQRNFPRVRLSVDKPLIVTGRRNEFLLGGGLSTWHVLALHLISRYVGTAAAEAIAGFYAVQWQRDRRAPYIGFHPKRDHGDLVVARVQAWLETGFAVARPVNEMVRRSGLSESTFKRRFHAATGYGPIEYVQLARVAAAKRRLEQTGDPIDDISWQVGYEDAASFRRLFKRLTDLTPGVYRRQFRPPENPAPVTRAA